MEFIQLVFALLEPARQAVVRGLDRQRRRCDAAPDRLRLVGAVEQGADDLVRRVAQDLPAAGFVLRRPVLGQPACLGRSQPRIGLDQALRHAFQAVVLLQRELAALERLELVDPARVAACGLGRARRGQAETLQIDQPAHALGPHAAVDQRDVAAHAVADQVDGCAAVAPELGIERIEQEIQVGQVLGRRDIVVDRAVVGRVRAGALRACQPEAAPVGRDHEALALQCIDHELERGRDIHPAMHQHQWHHARTVLAPAADMVALLAKGEKAAA